MELPSKACQKNNQKTSLKRNWRISSGKESLQCNDNIHFHCIAVKQFKIACIVAHCIANISYHIIISSGPLYMLYATNSYFLFPRKRNSVDVWCYQEARKKLCDKQLNVLSLNTMKRYTEGWKRNHCEYCIRKADTVEDKIWESLHAFAIWNSLNLVKIFHML